MHYLLCRTEVSDYDTWREVFDSHAAVQREHGLHVLNVLRDADDPSVVVAFMRAEDPERAREFTRGALAEQGAADAGVVDVADIWHLRE